MPTPPTGDMACAASPMHRRPGRYHRRNRSTCTVKSLTDSRSLSSPTRSAIKGASAATLARKASSPLPSSCGRVPFAMTRPHCQYSPRFNMIKDAAAVKPSHWVGRIARQAREPEPEHIHRCAERLDRQTGFRPQNRMSAVGPDYQIGLHLEPSLRSLRPETNDSAVRLDYSGYFCLHPQLKLRIPPAFVGVPLRHEGDKPASG